MTILAITRREFEVARAIAVDALTAKEAARRLGITERTVETHRTTILRKLGLHRTMEGFDGWGDEHGKFDAA